MPRDVHSTECKQNTPAPAGGDYLTHS